MSVRYGREKRIAARKARLKRIRDYNRKENEARTLNSHCYDCGIHYHEPLPHGISNEPSLFRCKACWAKLHANGYDDSQERDWE